MKLGFFDILLALSLVVAWGIVGSIETMRIDLLPGVLGLLVCLGAALVSVRAITR